MKLPRHTGYFKRLFEEKYGATPEKVTVKRTEDGLFYTIFRIPNNVTLDDEDSKLIIEDDLIAVRNYNAKYIPASHFDQDGNLEPRTYVRDIYALNKKYREAFLHSFRMIFKEDPHLLVIWRDLNTRDTYAFYRLPRKRELVPDGWIDVITDCGTSYEGFLCRYRQLDILPNSLFTEDGIKMDRGTAKERGVAYTDIRTDTDDYRPDETAEEGFERREAAASRARERIQNLTQDEKEDRKIKNREYWRQKTGYYDRHPEHKRIEAEARRDNSPDAFEIAMEQAEQKQEQEQQLKSRHDQHERDLNRERELETKDPITDEELQELEEVRRRLYAEPSL